MFRLHKKTLAYGVASILLFGSIIFVTSPDAKTWASDSWNNLFKYKIAEGTAGFTVEELTPEELLEDAQNPTAPQETESFVSVADASAKLGFTVTLPKYQPIGSQLIEIFGPKNDQTANMVFSGEGAFWVLSVSKAEDFVNIFANFEGKETTIGNQKVLIGKEHGLVPAQPKPTISAHDTIMWKTADGVIFKLTGTIPLDEQIKVVTSMIQ